MMGVSKSNDSCSGRWTKCVCVCACACVCVCVLFCFGGGGARERESERRRTVAAEARLTFRQGRTTAALPASRRLRRRAVPWRHWGLPAGIPYRATTMSPSLLRLPRLWGTRQKTAVGTLTAASPSPWWLAAALLSRARSRRPLQQGSPVEIKARHATRRSSTHQNIPQKKKEER